MLTHFSRDRRWLVYASLIVWWLWSTMALCYAQSFAATAATLPPASEPQRVGAMAMHEQHGNATIHAEHGAAATASDHDCCDDSDLTSCCGAVEALKTKSTADIDLQFVAVLLSWLVILTEPTLSAVPTVDTINSHAVIPRLHLLLCVFLD